MTDSKSGRFGGTFARKIKPAPIARSGPEIEEDLPDSTRQLCSCNSLLRENTPVKPCHALGGAVTVVCTPALDVFVRGVDSASSYEDNDGQSINALPVR